MKYFGTDGFRGEANRTLTADQAYKIGRYVGWHFTEGAAHPARLVVARDTRQSGTMLEAAIIAGLCASGVDVYDPGVIPTPSVSHVVREGRFDAGVMITASHNPFYDNGIKLVNAAGHKMEESVLEKVEAYMDGQIQIGFATDDHIGRAHSFEEGRQMYRDHLAEVAKGLSLEGVRIGLDCANGAASDFAAYPFRLVGAELMVINDTPDGQNINVACGSTHIQALQQLVRDNGLDMGFAFDGDADRCIAVDGNGEVVDGDKILYICGKYLAGKGALTHDTIVATVMSNIGFNKAVEAAGLKYELTGVGDKYVTACMREHGYVLGGEQSGHVVFADCEVTGDGIVTALQLTHAVQDAAISLAEAAAQMVQFPQLLVNVAVADKRQAMDSREVQGAIDEVSQLLGTDGRVLVRPSGTEPLIRVLVEAGSDEICADMAERVASQLRKFA